MTTSTTQTQQIRNPSTLGGNVRQLEVDRSVYNQEFSLAKILGRMNAATSELQPKGPAQSIDDRLEQTACERENHARTWATDDLLAKHRDTLHALGLTLVARYGGNGSIQDPAGTISGVELRYAIENRERFCRFLTEITPQEATEITSSLRHIVANLHADLLEYYSATKPDTLALNCLSSLRTTHKELLRLGYNDPATELAPLMKHLNERTLAEYLRVERSKIMVEVGHFGPGDWHADTSPTDLRRRWNKALRTLQVVESNPNAAQYAEQIRSHLKRCAEHSRGGLEQLRDSYSEEYKQALRPVLDEVLNILGAGETRLLRRALDEKPQSK
ncbi:MAG: hypothetical protein EBZ48_01410 [Proteobacteria bacterium]|nr:hypothetical protein [Pseudomonadota bacterium]